MPARIRMRAKAHDRRHHGQVHRPSSLPSVGCAVGARPVGNASDSVQEPGRIDLRPKEAGARLVGGEVQAQHRQVAAQGRPALPLHRPATRYERTTRARPGFVPRFRGDGAPRPPRPAARAGPPLRSRTARPRRRPSRSGATTDPGQSRREHRRGRTPCRTCASESTPLRSATMRAERTLPCPWTPLAVTGSSVTTPRRRPARTRRRDGVVPSRHAVSTAGFPAATPTPDPGASGRCPP